MRAFPTQKRLCLGVEEGRSGLRDDHVDSRRQTADGRQQTADSRQQPRNLGALSLYIGGHSNEYGYKAGRLGSVPWPNC
jgi:hypothetical protein